MTALKNFRVDSFVSGLAIKAPVNVATDLPITLSGEQTVNGVALVVGDRCLVKDQADPIENGVYNVETSAWQRSGDMDGERDIVGGTVVPAYRQSDSLFVYWIISGNGDPLSPNVDALNFTVFHDPMTSPTSLPTSMVEHSSLAADAVGGWVENSLILLDGTDIFADYTSASDHLRMGAGTSINKRISTATGSLELIADGGLGQIAIFGGSNLNILDGGTLYIEESADHNVVLVATGQYWVRSSDGAPMFTDSSSVDYQLNTAPSFAAPLVLLDEEEIQFGDSTDATIKWTAAGLGGGPGLQLSNPGVMALTTATELRIYNTLGTGYIALQNNGILSSNIWEWTAAGGGNNNVNYDVGPWDHNNHRFLRPVLDDYAIQHQTIGSISNVVDVSFEDGNSAFLELTENVTTFNINDPPVSGRLGQLEIEILQDSVARTITWPAAVLWPGGTAPDLSATSSRHLIHLRTRDGGTTYLGTYLENFS